MKKVEDEMNDELRPEYDLENLRVRKLGRERSGFGGQMVQFAPDVAEMFPAAELTAAARPVKCASLVQRTGAGLHNRAC